MPGARKVITKRGLDIMQKDDMPVSLPTMPADGIPSGARVLVTGATGFTGQVLVRKLCSLGVKVRAIARSTSSRENLAGLPVEWFEGQVYEPAVIAEAMQGVEYVLHVAAAYRDPSLADSEYTRVHVESTRHLAQAALGQRSFKRFVLVSTVGVHGHIEQPPANEQSPFNPGDIYQRTKAEAEQWLHGFARQKNLSYAVIRPAAIYGPGDRRLLKVFRMAKAPFFVMLGRGRCLYHLIHVEDLCEAIIRAAWHPAAEGEAFICGDPQSIALEDMGRIIAAELGRPFRPVRLPAAPFFALADLTEAICRPLKLSPPIYRRRVAFFTKDRSFDTRKIRETLGFAYKWQTADGLRDTARWYVDHKWL
jgi:nucleoside-diphosphate-sugar epimerase